MYGNKIWITGITILLAFPHVGGAVPWEIIGAIFTMIGCVLIWLDK